jgi:DNA-binding transcriptional MocR family regulator
MADFRNIVQGDPGEPRVEKKTNGPRQPFLYERISLRLLAQIRSGTYAIGDRMPSVRHMSEKLGVGINTVIQSYRQLEAEGYLLARPQSGFFVCATELDGIPEPDAARFPLLPVEVSLSEQVLRYMELHVQRGVIRLGIALPGAEIMPVRRTLKILSDVVRKQPLAAWDYMHPNGDGLMVHHLARRSIGYPVPVTADDIIVTSGCMEALNLALRCVSKPGDAIAVESPTYYGSLLLLEAHQRRAVEVPAHHRNGISLDKLEQVFQRGEVKACLVSANAQNPLGYTMSMQRKQELVALSARYGIPLIENDVWGDTVFDPSQAIPLKAFDRDGLVLYCNSFSKSLMPGFRLGWAVPGRFHSRFMELKQLSTITSPSAPQLAVGEMLQSGMYEMHLRTLRRRLYRQIEETGRMVLENFPSGTRVSRPSGGCVLWVRLPREIDSSEVFRRAAQRGIHVIPGGIFSTSQRHVHYLRLNAGNPMSSRIRAAIRLLGRIVHDVAGGEHQARH